MKCTWLVLLRMRKEGSVRTRAGWSLLLAPVHEGAHAHGRLGEQEGHGLDGRYRLLLFMRGRMRTEGSVSRRDTGSMVATACSCS
jgi:hypothetical protein